MGLGLAPSSPQQTCGGKYQMGPLLPQEHVILSAFRTMFDIIEEFFSGLKQPDSELRSCSDYDQ